MRALTLTAVVRPDHMLMVQVPAGIPPGTHQVVVVLQGNEGVTSPGERFMENWPVHDCGPIDPNMTFRREDIYGDDGR
jgi:hypothetical protein